jgi:hypothetical protein
MRSNGGEMNRDRRDACGRYRRASTAFAVFGFSALAFALSACSSPTALDSYLAKSDAEPAACVGSLFDGAIDVAEFECWRVGGINDLEGFTWDLVVAVNGGVPPTPDRSFCINPILAAPEAYTDCFIEWGSADQWFAVNVTRDIYSAEWDSLDSTGEFPAENVATIVIARSAESLSPGGGS